MPSPSTPNRTRVVLAAGVAVAIAVGIALFLSRGGSSSVTIRGEFTLTDEDGFTGRTEACFGEGGYSDFGPGMNVVVRDGEGNVIGTDNTRGLDDEHYRYVSEHRVLPLLGALGPSDDEEDELDVGEVADLYEGIGCTVVFTVEADEASFYAIEVGNRGELTYTDEELADQDFYVAFTLGD